MTKQSLVWHIRDIEVVVRFPSTSFVCQEQRKRDEENENMDKVMTQLDLLTERVMGSNTKVVNVIASRGTKEYDDDNVDSVDEKIEFI